MSQSTGISGKQDWWYFDTLPACSLKMISITKYDSSFAASRWLCVLKEELTDQLSPRTWLKRAEAQHKSRAALWANRTPKVVQILAVDNIAVATVESKNTFIQLLIQEFPGDLHNLITDEKLAWGYQTLYRRKMKTCTPIIDV